MAPPGAPGPWAMAVRWWRTQSEAHVQDNQLPVAVPGCPVAELFVQNVKAIVSKTYSKSRYYVERTSLKIILERNGKYVGVESWANFPGDIQQTSHHYL